MLASDQRVGFFLPTASPDTHQSPHLPHRPPPGAPPASAGCWLSSAQGTVLEGESGRCSGCTGEGLLPL